MAEDGLERYYTEKLWQQIPAVYRTEDGLAMPPDVLRGIVTLLAQQAARARRSQDRLWEDQFIELCDDWAVPYLGDLLATRMISALDRPGRRADVAKTIYYRRRSGTLAVLEELIADITRYEGTVVEELRRLVRTPHLLEPAPGARAGRFTGTLPGGLPDLRRPRGAELAGGPFDELSWTLDTRKHRGGKDGRYNIPKLGFHLYRLVAYRVTGASPAPADDTGKNFLFDPSGRDVPLFQRASRGDGTDPARFVEWRHLDEWELPALMRCRVLRDETAKAALYPASVSVDEPGTAPPTPIPTSQITAANLASWDVTTSQPLAIDPERGRLRFMGTAPPAATLRVTYHHGFSGPIGAGSYDRAANLAKNVPDQDHRKGGGALTAASAPSKALPKDRPAQLDDSATYGPIDPVTGITALTVQAADGARPYLRLDGDWVLTGAGESASLTLDGLWIGGGDLVLNGTFEEVVLRNCTLDPGGLSASGKAIRPVRLLVQATIRTLQIERCITGPIRTATGGSLETVTLANTIVDSVGETTVATIADPTYQPRPALDLASGVIDVRRATILGDAHLHRLEIATDLLATGAVKVDDVQHGCFRFSAAGPKSELPRPYRSVTLVGPERVFTSRIFGHPGYAQLSAIAGDELYRGAENGSEMGAFSALIEPIKLDGLWSKALEFMPFGLIPAFILET